MNLSLYKLRKRLNNSGQGSLVAVALGGVLLSTLVASATSWYLTMRNNIGNTEDKLEAQTIAMSEWERLSHMSLDELEANRNTFKTPYSTGTGSQYQVSVNLGEKGTFNNGTCGNVSGGDTNCFKNTTITVYRDGNRMFTTRTLPLMAGDYTRKEVDNLLASMRNDYNTKINNLSNKLSNDYYNKSQIDSKLNNLIRLENVDNNAKIPDGKALYAYLNGSKLPLSSQGGMGELYYCYTFNVVRHEGGSTPYSGSYYSQGWTISLQMKLETGYITIATVSPDISTSTFNNHTLDAGGYFDGQNVSAGWTYREKAK